MWLDWTEGYVCGEVSWIRLCSNRGGEWTVFGKKALRKGGTGDGGGGGLKEKMGICRLGSNGNYRREKEGGQGDARL